MSEPGRQRPTGLESPRERAERWPLTAAGHASLWPAAVFTLRLRKVQARHVLVRASFAWRWALACEVAGTSTVVAEDFDAGLVICVEEICHVATDTIGAFLAVGKGGHLVLVECRPVCRADSAASCCKLIASSCEVGETPAGRVGAGHVRAFTCCVCQIC